MRSVMSHNFSQIPRADIPRSSFDRSHGHKTTFDAGLLIPVYVDEALPGDTFNARMAAFGRLATPLHPFMDNLFMETQFFAVPLRLIWDNWERFNGAQDDPGDSTDFLVPTVTSSPTGFGEQSMSDYFGIPPHVPSVTVASLWHRAYNLIWNEWYRDENLQDSVPVPKGDGPDNIADFNLLRRGKRRDYFTSCLPWPQKGPAVELPLGSSAPVVGDNNIIRTFTANDPTVRALNVSATNVVEHRLSTGGGNSNWMKFSTVQGETGMVADLSDATAATINQLRQAFQIQKLYERDARGGTRYIELLKAHFGVTSPDARLQRPEYLGGGSAAINVSSVPQTSGTGAYTPTPQGNMAAYGTTGFQGHGFTKSFVEHCVIIGLISVRADLTYQQGLNRMFSRSTRWDFYWPALAHIGEQTVLNKEIYLQAPSVVVGPDQVNNLTFGYQERFAEYRYKPSIITGRFRSDATLSLDTWHLSQDFSALPVLNTSFIEDNPPIDRVIAVTDEPHMILDTYINLRCARPMPVYSVPGLIDHF
jgi:hypothetical protein